MRYLINYFLMLWDILSWFAKIELFIPTSIHDKLWEYWLLMDSDNNDDAMSLIMLIDGTCTLLCEFRHTAFSSYYEWHWNVVKNFL